MTSYPIKVGSASGPASVVYVPMDVASSSYDRYPKKLSIGLGAMQIVFGVLCIVFNSVSLAFHDGLELRGNGIVCHGIWCGTLFIITGVIGIAAGTKKRKCEIVTNMVMCIISACFNFYLLLYGIMGALETNWQRYFACSPHFNIDRELITDIELCKSVTVVVAMESCLAIAGVIEAVLFICGSVLGCKSGACCCSGSYQAMALTPEYVQLTENKHCDDPPPVYEEED